MFAEHPERHRLTAGLTTRGLGSFLVAHDHIAGFQARPNYTSSGLLTRMVGFQDLPTLGAGDDVTTRRGLEVRDVIMGSGASSIVSNVGVYIETLAQGSNNYAISVGDTYNGVGGGDAAQNLLHVNVTGDPIFSWDESQDVFQITHGLAVQERSSDPADPDEGEMVLWQSDGTAFGEDGDVVLKITAGGTTKTHTLIDFSAITDEQP